jgi:phage/plasmid-like protein (TIGR03299 family)
MSHEITRRQNGFHEMAYVGQKPWHGLGQELEQGAPIEKWLVSAGMDWKVQRSKVRFATQANQGAEFATWDDYHVLMRSDTKAPLGMVSDKYKVVQPKDVLEFFRDLMEAAGYHLETTETLYGGRKFWALASIGAEERVVGNDLLKGRLLVATSCDGSMKTTVKNVAERVVCNNTLQLAMNEKGATEVAITHRTTFDARAIKKQLGIAVDSFHRFIADARLLAARKVDRAEADAFMATVLKEAEVAAAKEQRAFRSIMDLFHGAGHGSRLPGVAGTAWGLVNAVTEYVDHDRPNRNEMNRLNSAWFGSGADMKDRALSAARELVYVDR